jgi:hypothetical protein
MTWRRNFEREEVGERQKVLGMMNMDEGCVAGTGVETPSALASLARR